MPNAAALLSCHRVSNNKIVKPSGNLMLSEAQAKGCYAVGLQTNPSPNCASEPGKTLKHDVKVHRILPSNL